MRFIKDNKYIKIKRVIILYKFYQIIMIFQMMISIKHTNNYLHLDFNNLLNKYKTVLFIYNI